MSKNVDFIGTFIDGYKSIQEMEFDFEQPGINLIKGMNGVGKTSVFEAMFWCLYGESLKKLLSDSVATKLEYRPEGYKGTRVRNLFKVNGSIYEVVRHFQFKGKTKSLLNKSGMEVVGGDRLMIFKDGTQVSSELNKNAHQAYINTLLGVDHKTFLNSVLFGQRMKRLIEADSVDKREIFSQFFDIEFIDNGQLKAVEYREKLTTKIATETSEINNLIFKIETYENSLKESLVYKQNWENAKKENIEELKTELKTVKDSIKKENMPEYSGKLSILETEWQEIVNEINFLTQLNQSKNQEILILGTIQKPTSKCEVCGGKLLPKVFDELMSNWEIAQNKIKNLQTDIDKNLIEIEEYESNKKLKTDEVIIEDKIYETHLKSLAEYNSQLEVNKVHQKNVLSIEEKIKSVKASKYKPLSDLNYEQLITDSKLQKDELEASICDRNELKAMFNWWATKGFGANGLKNYIINAMLTILNSTVKRYSSRLGLEINFSIDLIGKTKKFTVKVLIDGVELDYNELSGGEKSRADLSMSFGIFDMLCMTKTKFNILILDEAFENLDEPGVYDFFEIMREKAKDTNIFSISFNEKIDKLNVNTIYLEKINHQTVMI